ncbi:alpha/beta hydrolase family protein [Micromonospora echinofusca]|uniref:Chlorophyllase n=1 Tax=Micromonospora echinofusca TaxID=47858 RepID=A0ABS3VPW6_MICEH|nr:chlorophyllase [Micromonospora echinofusca]MBO4206590.1 chlorophyllase [Micromonospora echinofusca]
MRRRRTPALLAAALLTVALAGCSDDGARWRDDGPSAPAASAPAGGPRPSASPVPAGSAPAEPFAVGVRELKLTRDGDRALPVTIWYPATGSPGGDPRRGRPAARGRFPVVVFSHGLTARPADYAALLGRWAAAGFVVAAPTFPGTSRGAARYDVLDVLNQPADVSFVLTRVLALDGRAGDPLRGRLATDRVAATGHSAGGVTTVGLFTVERDDRLDAGIVLAGSALGVGTAFAGTDAPQLFVHGERDEVVSYSAGRAAYEAVPWPKAMLSLPDGDHGRALLRGDDRSFAVVADTTVEFLRWSLYGDAAAKRRLPADAARGGLATLDDQL